MQLTIAIPMPMIIHAVSLVIAFIVGVIVGWVCARPTVVSFQKGERK